ncbi:MAG: hypothetical protein P8X96_08485 [Desulfobacteraceae bacterium]
MKKNRVLLNTAASVLIAAGVCIIIAACGGKDDTAAIYELIEKGTALAEERQVGDLLDLTLPDFVAQPGGRNRQETKGVLFAAFMHYGQFKIRYPRPQVEIHNQDDSAMATVHFLIVRQNQPFPGLKELYDNPRKWIEEAGEKADLYQLKLDLKKDGGDWRVGRAELEGFKGTGF